MARGKRNRAEEATPSVAKRLRSSSNSEAGQETSSTEPQNGHQKKQILLNAFDMSTVGHLSPGQWKNPKDSSAKKRDLKYWIDLAKILERGGINALFLADTYGGYDTYEGSLDNCIRRAAQWPVTDPTIKSAFKAIGIDTPIEHDQRYAQADEYLRVLYKLWEGSWSEDAIINDIENDAYIDPDKISSNPKCSKFTEIRSRAGSAFASKHAEAIFVTGHDPSVVAPKIANIRRLAKEEGRDPTSLKFFCTFTPIVGRTDEEAQEKLAEVKKYASTIGGLVLVSGWTGIDLSKLPLGKEITKEDSLEAHKVTSALSAFTTTSKNVPKWTPEVVAEVASIGGLGPVSVGSPSTVADELERWVAEADVDGFNLGYVTTPGTFEDVVDLLVPELRRRGIYPQKATDGLTAREKVYGSGQAHLRSDHTGSAYKYDVYKEDLPYVEGADQRK
ncbi:hypothetical protein ACLOAV_000483 [Pseudogymnoascus australis]